MAGERYSFAVMLQITTADPRLSEASLARMVGSAGTVAQVRHAILQHLPKDVSRVIAVLPLDHARMLMLLLEAAGTEITAGLRAQGSEVSDDGAILVRPPADYVPPTTG